MSQTGTRIRRGDVVRIMAGKDVGKEGKVLRAIAPDPSPKKKRPSRVVVEGLNIMIKHVRPKAQQNVTPAAQQQQSGRVEMEAPIYTSKVMLICPNCGQPTRVGIGSSATGERFRACKKCDKQID
jgi:large subunit ribosomal protein L24